MGCKRKGEAVSASSKWLCSLLVLTFAACGGDVPPQPSYDDSSRQLTRLDVDTNGDGRIDQRTYLNGNLPLRSEMDENGDGRVDRWEYVNADGDLVTIGTSSRDDGLEDRWTTAVEENGERRLAVSSGRDRHVGRVEFFRGYELARVEEDSNADGLPDKWETYEGGRLRHLAFDTSRASGRPDRLLTYDAQGQVERVEADADRNGQFEVVAPDKVSAGATR